MYSVGKFTGFSIDLGDRFTNFTPVFDGFSLPYANFRQNLGGKDLTEYIVKALLDEGYSFFTKSSRLIAEKIKRRYCRCRKNLITCSGTKRSIGTPAKEGCSASSARDVCTTVSRAGG